MEPSKEERREVEEMEEVDLEEGRAGGEMGNGERISSMVCVTLKLPRYNFIPLLI